MNDEQQRISSYLNQNARGFRNKKSVSEIRGALGLDSGGPTNEHDRELVRDMILNHNCLIGSLNYKPGYWIIENEEELNTVIDHIEKRASSVQERADALKRNWDNRNQTS